MCPHIGVVDLKRMYWQTGVADVPTVFLYTDAQVPMESFMEDVSNMLSSGEVPTLYKPEEFEEIRQALLDRAKLEGISESAQVCGSEVV